MLKEATCPLYGKDKCESINKARLEMFKKAFQSKVDKKKEAKVQGMAVARKPMPLCALLPHMRGVLREAYVQKMALLGTPVIPQSTECRYSETSRDEQKCPSKRGVRLIEVNFNRNLPLRHR